MAGDTNFLLAIVGMALASYACRVTGFLLMHWVPVTPRVEAALRAIPLGVMVGIVMPSLASGRVPELAGLAMVLVLMKTVRNDLVAAVGGAAAVGVCRAMGL
ncbi:MAG TPA: AzlD domain-containing protein [Ramlibacter sp.]|nr:AzlD domain-containing protein [Ramlibacter sp.]